jgi:hypothetical protein
MLMKNLFEFLQFEWLGWVIIAIAVVLIVWLSILTCQIADSRAYTDDAVEHAQERAGEGLSVDQWQEVQVMINNSLGASR